MNDNSQLTLRNVANMELVPYVERVRETEDIANQGIKDKESDRRVSTTVLALLAIVTAVGGAFLIITSGGPTNLLPFCMGIAPGSISIVMLISMVVIYVRTERVIKKQIEERELVMDENIDLEDLYHAMLDAKASKDMYLNLFHIMIAQEFTEIQDRSFERLDGGQPVPDSLLSAIFSELESAEMQIKWLENIPLDRCITIMDELDSSSLETYVDDVLEKIQEEAESIPIHTLCALLAHKQLPVEGATRLCESNCLIPAYDRADEKDQEMLLSSLKKVHDLHSNINLRPFISELVQRGKQLSLDDFTSPLLEVLLYEKEFKVYRQAIVGRLESMQEMLVSELLTSPEIDSIAYLSTRELVEVIESASLSAECKLKILECFLERQNPKEYSEIAKTLNPEIAREILGLLHVNKPLTSNLQSLYDALAEECEKHRIEEEISCYHKAYKESRGRGRKAVCVELKALIDEPIERYDTSSATHFFFKISHGEFRELVVDNERLIKDQDDRYRFVLQLLEWIGTKNFEQMQRIISKGLDTVFFESPYESMLKLLVKETRGMGNAPDVSRQMLYQAFRQAPDFDTSISPNEKFMHFSKNLSMDK